MIDMLAQVITAADEINLPRIKWASVKKYADFLVAESVAECMTTWIVYIYANKRYLKLDNKLKGIKRSPGVRTNKRSPGVRKNNGISQCQ